MILAGNIHSNTHVLYEWNNGPYANKIGKLGILYIDNSLQKIGDEPGSLPLSNYGNFLAISSFAF